MKRAVEEPRLHNQLLPNTTTLERDIDQVGRGRGNRATVGSYKVSWDEGLDLLSHHRVAHGWCLLPGADDPHACCLGHLEPPCSECQAICSNETQ